MLYIYLLLGALCIFIAVLLIRTFTLQCPTGNAQLQPLPVPELPQEALDRLSGAIQIPTISNRDYEKTDTVPFTQYIQFIRDAFPVFNKTLSCESINEFALIYRWHGRNAELPALLMMAHYDVVPASDNWKYPPFSGQIAEGKIWGRGTLDIKSQMIAHMECVEKLIAEGFTPERDVYFVYGHDEEVGGEHGAKKIAAHFAAENIRFAAVLDEGGIVVSDILPSIQTPLALIGVSEKGMCNYRVRFNGTGGHSSMPPKHTSLGLAAEFIRQMERKPLPQRLTPPLMEFLRNVAGEMGFIVRMAVANTWLFKPILLRILSGNSSTNALSRTTFAATMAEASTAANVLPNTTEININVRLLHGDTSASVKSYLENLAPETGAQVSIDIASEASALSVTDSTAFRYLTALIKRFYPGCIATSYLMVGGTDSRRFTDLSDFVYRFTPTLLTNEEKDTVHNDNESISLENYARMVAFYYAWIAEFDKS